MYTVNKASYSKTIKRLQDEIIASANIEQGIPPPPPRRTKTSHKTQNLPLFDIDDNQKAYPKTITHSFQWKTSMGVRDDCQLGSK
jgi:hypothetical protein